MSEPDPRRPSRRKGALSRYDIAGAREPTGGRAPPPRSPNVMTAIVAVPDPNPDPSGPKNERTIATVNRRVDILELERSAGRLSDAAYAVGRIVQAVFERARGIRPSRGWRERDRVDAAWVHEVAIVYALDDARKVHAYKERIRSALGMIDARLLEQVLGDCLTYAECAAARGRAGERGIAYYAARFRDALEALADAWAAKGRG
jgi:hypothetical protein